MQNENIMPGINFDSGGGDGIFHDWNHGLWQTKGVPFSQGEQFIALPKDSIEGGYQGCCLTLDKLHQLSGYAKARIQDYVP
ncbi:MAG: hypothetical protein NPINA01_23580 [Nitrospinaceae bacterium]|nr:MAG: hypothetical protein NPINA01_23580 [Nitrospinaceae bacterium]